MNLDHIYGWSCVPVTATVAVALAGGRGGPGDWGLGSALGMQLGTTLTDIRRMGTTFIHGEPLDGCENPVNTVTTVTAVN